MQALNMTRLLPDLVKPVRTGAGPTCWGAPRERRPRAAAPVQFGDVDEHLFSRFIAVRRRLLDLPNAANEGRGMLCP